MQLTDAEIREILRQQKIKKKRKLRTRRRITILIVLVLIALAVYFIKGQIDTIVAENTPPRGIIFIDPGHGGKDPGSGNGARYEKEDTLRLALAVRTYLEEAGFQVFMSHTEDEDVDRIRRGEMANECGAQLMVSIHRNKADTGGDGVEAFIPKDNNAESRLLGTNILRNLAAQGFTLRSVRAGTLQSTEEDYDENAYSKMPSCLVEVGFLSNMHDNELFDNNLENNAKAIANAIDDTFRTLYEPAAGTDGTTDGSAGGTAGDAASGEANDTASSEANGSANGTANSVQDTSTEAGAANGAAGTSTEAGAQGSAADTASGTSDTSAQAGTADNTSNTSG
ncbi:MAG: N-acetylmuramoyl-L-alanine amidase [Mogibacterium sp.]|nr:N-acetylmuramoyl-L-alanine amidase [Mogibacterium sp.]